MSSNAKRLANQRYYWNHRDEFKERFHKKWIELKKEVLSHYGELKCNYCGNDDINELQLEHVNNDGWKHRQELLKAKKIKKGWEGVGLYRYLKKNNYISEYQLQVLCKKCNVGKENKRRVGDGNKN